MFPSVRKKRSRPAPSLEMSTCSGPAAPLKSIVSVPVALDDVGAVATVPDEGVVTGTHDRDVGALVAVNEVVAVSADKVIGGVGAEEGVIAGAAVDGGRHDAGDAGAAGER